MLQEDGNKAPFVPVEIARLTKEMSSVEIRTTVMNKFQDYLGILHTKILENRSKEKPLRQRSLATVVVSLWEEDQTMITSKMFQESLLNLRNQAQATDMDLDFVVVANNGGGKNAQIGENMIAGLRKHFEEAFGEENFHEVKTTPRDQNDPSIPWNANIPLSQARAEGQDRCFLVIQPSNKLNEGKIRALRDISDGLYSQIMEGYAPDAVFQMDAETILEYKPSHHVLIKPPFRAMFDALQRRDGVVAIGTKDRFEPMDPETGKPLGTPRPIAQEGMTQINTGKRENFISLPGGAILAKPEYYVAGMKALTEVTYGNIAEDYMFTQILREYARTHNLEEPVRVNSLNVVTHLNRCPQGKDAIKQLLRWKEQGNAVDQVFPDSKYNYKPLIEYMRLTMKSRLRSIIKHPRRYFLQTLKDALSIPGMIEIATDRRTSDIVNGRSTWEQHSDN
jgi:hypothetical protein